MTDLLDAPAVVAQRPPGRTAELELPAPYEGWTATVRLDFPARILFDLGSGELDQVCEGLDAIIVEHNFPDETGNLAKSMADVDPAWAVVALLKAYNKHRATVPNP